MAGDVGFQLSQGLTAIGSVPQVMWWPRREPVLWTRCAMSWAGTVTPIPRTIAKEIFPKDRQKIGSGKHLGLGEPRRMTLEQSDFPGTCHEYHTLLAPPKQTAGESLCQKGPVNLLGTWKTTIRMQPSLPDSAGGCRTPEGGDRSSSREVGGTKKEAQNPCPQPHGALSQPGPSRCSA